MYNKIFAKSVGVDAHIDPQKMCNNGGPMWASAPTRYSKIFVPVIKTILQYCIINLSFKLQFYIVNIIDNIFKSSIILIMKYLKTLKRQSRVKVTFRENK